MRHQCVLGPSSPAHPVLDVPWGSTMETLLVWGAVSPSPAADCGISHQHGLMENTVFWRGKSPDAPLISSPVKSDGNPSSGVLHCGGREVINSD